MFTVNKLLESAKNVLMTKGYGECSTNLIAQHAEFSIGALYEYFYCKEGVFTELKRRHESSWVHRVFERESFDSYSDLIRHLIQCRKAFLVEELALAVNLESNLPGIVQQQGAKEAFSDVLLYVKKHMKPLSKAKNGALIKTSDLEFIIRTINGTLLQYALFNPTQLNQKHFDNRILAAFSQYTGQLHIG